MSLEHKNSFLITPRLPNHSHSTPTPSPHMHPPAQQPIHINLSISYNHLKPLQILFHQPPLPPSPRLYITTRTRTSIPHHPNIIPPTTHQSTKISPSESL